MNFSLQAYKMKLLMNSLLEEMRRGVRELFNSLIKNEMQLVDQIELIFQEFERTFNEKIVLFLEQIRIFMTQCRELSKEFTEKIKRYCNEHSR